MKKQWQVNEKSLKAWALVYFCAGLAATATAASIDKTPHGPAPFSAIWPFLLIWFAPFLALAAGFGLRALARLGPPLERIEVELPPQKIAVLSPTKQNYWRRKKFCRPLGHDDRHGDPFYCSLGTYSCTEGHGSWEVPQ